MRGKKPPPNSSSSVDISDQWKAHPNEEFPGTAYAATPSGWMETKIFKNYFKKTLVPALGDKRPVLVIYDGHSTHVSLDLVEYDILQPLDVSVFKSYKDKWDQTLQLGSGNILVRSYLNPYFLNLQEKLGVQSATMLLGMDLEKPNTVSSETPSSISHSPIEQIILSRIQQKDVPSSQKRRKVASGAEAITSTKMIELLKLKEQTQSAKKDVLELQENAIEPDKRVLLVDDLLATGGTLLAAYQLIKKAGGYVAASLIIIELEALKGRDALPTDVISLIKL
nr:unnamed protein product [Callosobruchus chinensis]